MLRRLGCSLQSRVWDCTKHTDDKEGIGDIAVCGLSRRMARARDQNSVGNINVVRCLSLC